MRKVKVLPATLALLCLQHAAISQTGSATSFTTGFELGTMAESSVFGNSGTVRSAVVHSRPYAYRAHPIYSNQRIAFASVAARGVRRQIFRSSRSYLCVAQLSLNGSVSIVKLGGAATFNPEIDLNWDGPLILADSWYPAIAKSQNALTADGLCAGLSSISDLLTR